MLLISVLFAGCFTRINQKPKPQIGDVVLPEQENSIKSWVKEYALYPDSYKPLDFRSSGSHFVYYNGPEIIPFRKLKIEHTFSLQDTGRKELIATFIFQLQQDNYIDRVDYKNENLWTRRYYPPEYDNFIGQFGRSYTNADSSFWKENYREELYELEVQFINSRYDRTVRQDTMLQNSIVSNVNRIYKDQLKKASQ
jgi:hypothetical protein